MTAFRPGEVYAYHYLWRRQQRSGEESGRKVRPCSLVFRSSRSPAELYLFPITTQPPQEPGHAMEIPLSERARCGLDQRCWLIMDEFNITLETRLYDFASTRPLGEFSAGFVKMLAARIAIVVRTGAIAPVKRS